LKKFLFLFMSLLAAALRAELDPALAPTPEFESAQAMDPRETELFTRGKAELAAGHFEEAIQIFKRLLRFDPKLVEAWYQLGISYASAGQYPQAVDAYRLTLERNPNCGQCHCALSLALRETRHAPESLSEARNCLRLIPDYAGAWNLIGNVQLDLGEPREALRAYQKAVELKPAYVNARYNLALTLETLGRHKDAEGQLQEVLRQQPGMLDGWMALGNGQLKQHKNQDALLSFKRALKISPQSADAKKGVALASRAVALDQRRAR
jgi:tetratricopeptide (TPR) repeat protein